MGFEAHWPSGGPYTVSFTPSADPVVADSGDEVDDGVVGEIAADGRTVWSQQLGTPATIFTRKFNRLSIADRAADATFRAVVLGDAFDFIDSCGPVTVLTKVKFAPDGHRVFWGQAGGQKQSTIWIMIEQD